MLLLVHLEVLGLQTDLLGVPAHGVSDRAYTVDCCRAVAEFVGARLRQEFPSSSSAWDRVIARPGPGQRREDLLQSGAADLAFPDGRKGEPPFAVLHDLVLLQSPAELLEVNSRIDDAPLLQVLHPLERLLDVPAGLEHELQKEAGQLLERQELPEQVGWIVGVTVTHRA